MDHRTFVHQVMSRASLPTEDEATRAIEATLPTLAERVTGEEARHLAAQLPPPLQPLLDGGKGDRFGLDEFVRRVAEREGVDGELAHHHAGAVLSVVRDAVTPGELADLVAQLPGSADFSDLPIDDEERDLEAALGSRGRRSAWHRVGLGEWATLAGDGPRAVIRCVAGDYQTAVGDDRGVFATPEEALDHVERALGWLPA